MIKVNKEEGILYKDQILKCRLAIFSLLKNATKDKCVCCGHKIIPHDLDVTVDMYDHDGGWTVCDSLKKQWLSIHCDKCNYDNSLWKLGIIITKG